MPVQEAQGIEGVGAIFLSAFLQDLQYRGQVFGLLDLIVPGDHLR